MIKAEINTAGYSFRQPVLKNVNLIVNEGECVLITGPSGSGKTTLLLTIVGVINNLLYGFVDGKIAVDGLNPLNNRDFVKLPKVTGVVLQEPDKQIAMPTPMEEVLFTMENLGFDQDYAVSKATEMLKLHGLIDKAWSHVEDLSIGEKRRVTLISSTIHEPRVILLDEPTASMDPRGLRLIREFVKENRESGRTVIIVEHKDEFFLDLVNRVYRISDGYLTEVREEKHRNLVSLERGDIIETRGSENIGEDEVVKASSLSVGYRGRALISNIDLEVRRGESIAILGFNGSGKSTLLKTIMGFLKPIGGELRVYGKAFYVPQEPDYMFLSKSVGGEIKLIERKTGLRRDEILMNNVWLNDVLEKPPYRLSHGQKRVLSIVIAFCHKPDLILLDEPTSGLDDANVNWVVDSVVRLKKRGVSFIVATHDLRTLGVADRVFLVDKGRLREVDHGKAIEWFVNNVYH